VERVQQDEREHTWYSRMSGSGQGISGPREVDRVQQDEVKWVRYSTMMESGQCSSRMIGSGESTAG
jgi:hypothetical protein